MDTHTLTLPDGDQLTDTLFRLSGRIYDRIADQPNARVIHYWLPKGENAMFEWFDGTRTDEKPVTTPERLCAYADWALGVTGSVISKCDPTSPEAHEALQERHADYLDAGTVRPVFDHADLA